MARPMPELPPVTMATRSVNASMAFSLLGYGRALRARTEAGRRCHLGGDEPAQYASECDPLHREISFVPVFAFRRAGGFSDLCRAISARRRRRLAWRYAGQSALRRRRGVA